MFHTRSDLDQTTRQNVSSVLQKRLADAIDLMLQAKQAHWNVKGPHFIPLHELFYKISESVEHDVALLAGRITQLGEVTEGTCKEVAKNTTLPEYPISMIEDGAYVEHLSNLLAEFGRKTRQGIREAILWNDDVTTDIFTEISRNTDRNLWLVESHAVGQQAKEVVQPVKGVA